MAAWRRNLLAEQGEELVGIVDGDGVTSACVFVVPIAAAVALWLNRVTRLPRVNLINGLALVVWLVFAGLAAREKIRE